MTQTPYQRVDLKALEKVQEQRADSLGQADTASYGIRLTVLPMVLLLSMTQVGITIYGGHMYSTILTSTLIAIGAFAMLFLGGLVVNPMLRMPLLSATAVLGGVLAAAAGFWFAGSKGIISEEVARLFVGATVFVVLTYLLRLVRYRSFNRQEMLCFFAALTVSSGVSTFGLADQLVPIVLAPKNPVWNTPQKDWEGKVIPTLKSDLYIQEPTVIVDFYRGTVRTEDGKMLETPPSTATLGENVTHWRKVASYIPWAVWAKPLFYWLIFVGAVYGLFYSLTYVLLGNWMDREKLIFPLARLPEVLLPDAGPNAGWVPKVFKTPGFWIGFALAFLVLGWNGINTANVISNIGTIPLGMNKFSVNATVAGSIFEGVGGGREIGMLFLVIFTAIGIAFLLPLEISFSIWMYWMFSRFLMLVMVWMGYGQNQKDFPSDWLWDMNAATAQGGGGMLMFSAICLYKAVKDYFVMIKGKSFGERVVILVPLIGLVVSILVLMGWLSWNGIPLLWALVFVALLTLLTIGLMRIVAEGGVYWFQSHTSFFHIYRITGGFGGFLPGTIVAPLFPIYSVLFMDIKAYIAPNLMNIGNMQAKSGNHSRLKFHTAVLSSLVVSVISSLAFLIFLGYLKGGNKLGSWFFSSSPQDIMAKAQGVITTPPDAMPTMLGWYGVGAAWVAFSFWIRTSVFWFPHPVGYIMLINPLMSQLWFSFFIGWVFKKLVVKYGGKMTFDKVRDMFIGLIVGELMAIFFWLMLSMFTKIKASNISLNRYSMVEIVNYFT
jgi:hypothetical protein